MPKRTALQQAGRSGTKWEAARKAVLAEATHCALCGEPLDFSAPPRSRYAPSVDHVIPLEQLQHYLPLEAQRMATDVSLLRAAHYGCNAGRGNSTRVGNPYKPRKRAYHAGNW